MKQRLTALMAAGVTLTMLPMTALAERPVIGNPHKDNPRARITVEQKLQAAEARKEAIHPSTPKRHKKSKTRQQNPRQLTPATPVTN